MYYDYKRQVGNADWKACDDCRHAPKEGGCGIESPTFSTDGDYFYCEDWEKAEEAEADRITGGSNHERK